MTYHEFQNEYRRERLLLSAGFFVLMLIIGGVHALQHPQELMFLSTQAADYPKEIFSSVIHGVAQR